MAKRDHLTERCFWWGLRSPKITPAKEKEKKIERVKRRKGGEEKSTGGTLSFYIDYCGL